MTKIETGYETVVPQGKVISKSSTHNWNINCDCDKNATLANYRDLCIDYEQRLYYFYHNTPVAIFFNSSVRLDSGGWKTKSTKDRINEKLPKGYKLKQRSNEWLVETPEGIIDFEDGMVIELV